MSGKIREWDRVNREKERLGFLYLGEEGRLRNDGQCHQLSEAASTDIVFPSERSFFGPNSV